MTEEGFRRYLRPFIEAGTPFCAYWHPRGFGLLRLDAVRVPVVPPWGWHGPGVPPTRAHQVGKRGLRTWEKNLARLRRETWGRLVTIDYDGKTVNVDGGGPEWDEFKGGIQA